MKTQTLEKYIYYFLEMLFLYFQPRAGVERFLGKGFVTNEPFTCLKNNTQIIMECLFHDDLNLAQNNTQLAANML